MSDKFSNDLSEAQLERLALLSEEMGEAQQVIGKIIRHGYRSWNPTVVERRTNREDLEFEMGHVTCAFGLLADAGDIDRMTALGQAIKKKESVKKWMHHQAPAIAGKP
jgi:NTP pyrophosphatase (non-canonical NTP hydrolase)